MFQTWGVRQLVASWVLYWIGLMVVVFVPTLWEIWSIRRAQGNDGVSWSYEGDLLPALLWILGPPLLITFIWLITRPRKQ